MGNSEELERLTRRVAELESLLASEKEARQSAEEHSRTNRYLVEQSLGLMCVHDLDGVLLFINRGAAESLGYSPEEGVGRSLREFLPRDVWPEFEDYLRRIRRNTRDSGLMRLQARDGSQRVWLYRNVKIAEPGGAPRIFGHAQDVTQLVRAERALRESEQRFRAIADTAPVLIWIAGPDSRVTFVNRPWLDFTGRAMHEELGEGWLDNVHPADLQFCMDTYLSAMRERRDFRMEYRVRRFDGEYRWLLDTGVPRVAPDGSLTGYIGCCTDVTESKIAKEQLQRATDELASRVAARTAELEEANRRLVAEMDRRQAIEEELLKARKLESVGVLAGGIAHEFNNVLTVILGNLALAQMQVPAEGCLPEVLGRVESACHHATELSRQLLTFATGGKPVREVARVGEILERAAGTALRGTNCRFELELDPALWAAEVDPGQIGQAVENIVLNAAEAMNGAGIVRITAVNVNVAGGVLPLESGEYVRISIHDEGPGIPREVLPKVFDPYFTTKAGGRGLGLAAAFAIITKHQGYITAESEPGCGTAVHLYLPALNEGPAAGFTAAASQPASGRILIMDDEESIRALAMDILGHLGYEVDGAREGMEAVVLYEEARKTGRPFQAVLLDLTVPGGMGGKETLRRLLEIDPGVRAIVSSGYSEDPIMADFQDYGFAGRIAKPWTIAALSSVLQQILPK